MGRTAVGEWVGGVEGRGRTAVGPLLLEESRDGIPGTGGRAVVAGLHGDAGLAKLLSCTDCSVIQCLGQKERHQEA